MTDKPEKLHSEEVSISAIATKIARMNGRRIAAIDGVDGAGKTTFADKLAPLVVEKGKPVLRASIDGFHNPRAVRYHRGKADALGYFLNSYNYAEFQDYLINPFRAGDERVHLARFEHQSDRANAIVAPVPPHAVLIVDGIFLHRNELCANWDLSIFLDTPFAETFRRMSLRDGFDPNPLATRDARYLQGQGIYLATCNPKQRASLVLNG
jgi:uridine kinase